MKLDPESSVQGEALKNAIPEFLQFHIVEVEPEYLQESLDRMKKAWHLLDSGVQYLRWDCDYCELQSNINCAEIDGLINEEQAWYLREKYLRMERGEIID